MIQLLLPGVGGCGNTSRELVLPAAVGATWRTPGSAGGTSAVGQGSSVTTVPAPPARTAPATIGLQLSGLVASLPLWGASDSAMASMWQEVGTVTHGWL